MAHQHKLDDFVSEYFKALGNTGNDYRGLAWDIEGFISPQ